MHGTETTRTCRRRCQCSPAAWQYGIVCWPPVRSTRDGREKCLFSSEELLDGGDEAMASLIVKRLALTPSAPFSEEEALRRCSRLGLPVMT